MRPVSDLKTIAKRRMAKNYGILIGAAALTILVGVTLYLTESAILVMGVDFRRIESLNDLIDVFSSPALIAMNYGLSLIVSLLLALFMTGYKRICLIVARDLKPSLSDLLFPFKYNPDKVILLSFIIWIVSTIGSLTSFLTGSEETGGVSMLDGRVFFAGMVLEVVSLALLIAVSSWLFAGYYIYLDDPDRPVVSIIRQSVQMMRGNVLRLIYLTLTFTGWFLLVILTYGVALLYVAPYM
ncbi:MAG: DUF975 family protein, partial [Lachnospiraceae bacterium]|nr:DUF975 family protein [Lachnospiraceae bacterium]